MSGAETNPDAFHEKSSRTGGEGERYGRWRALGAASKADHVLRLARVIGLGAPSTVAEIGCGDGAILDRLGSQGFGEARVGYEISTTATALAADRAGVTEAHLFDGRSVPVPDHTYDLVIASHVLEHVAYPGLLLREMARIGRAVIVEVPLEANLSARRPSAFAASRAAGHRHRFSRRDIRGLVTGAGLRIDAELRDPLPLAFHLFESTSLAAILRGHVKWAARTAIANVPVAGERLITLHYALAARPAAPLGNGGR